MSKVKTAVIGHGHLGKWHTQKAAALNDCELVAVVESHEAKHDELKSLYPGVKIVSDVSEVINEIDAAIIVTPTSAHVDALKYLLENSKHIFCEKPLCSNSKEIDSIESLVSPNFKLQVGHSERCHAIWDTFKKEISEIKGTKIVKINRFAAFKGRATDVDVVQDLMIHDIDLMYYLFEKEIKSIEAYGLKIRTSKFDHCHANITLEDGTLCMITSGRNSTHEVREIEVMSENGSLRVDMMNNTFSKGHKDQFSDESFVKETTYEKRDHLLIEQEHFYQSILNNTDVFVNFEDAKKAVKALDLIIQSAESNEKIEL